MPGLLDDLASLSVGSERIALSQSAPNTLPRAFATFAIKVDYALTKPEEVMLPLEMIVTSPSKSRISLFRRVVPTTLSLLPDEGGRWIVTLREIAHNHWWGRLVFEVTGDRIST